jgi:nucleoid-associated protein YgaU
VKYLYSNRKTTELNCTAAWDRSRQRLHAGAILFAACAIGASAPVWAQDVAEAARQEQARKEKQASHLKHVYTEEDLKRARILTREDRELLDAKKKEQAVPGGSKPATDLDAQTLDQLPLGDVARIFRAMKELSLQTGQTAEFHLPFSNDVLASPKAKPEFSMPKPREIQPSNGVTPAAPVFADAVETSPKAQREFQMPRPRAMQSSKRAGVTAPVFKSTIAASASPVAVSPTTEFAMSKPRVAQPAVGAAPLAPVFPNEVAPRSIIAKRGDSFWKLAQVNLGDGHRWHELVAVNPAIVNPNHIVPGTPINIVGAAPVAPASPSETSDSRITVRKGDSLWKIAQIQLGFGGFWGCIAKTNPMIVDPNRIYTGQVLSLPTSCGKRTSK